MPLPTSRKNVGLGRAIMNRKAKEAQHVGSSQHHTTDTGGHQPSWMKLQSVTQEGDLEEFLNTAQMADTDFTAERRNVTVISAQAGLQNKHNPYLLTGEEEEEVRKKHKQNRQKLRVPRRPKWSSESTKDQLDRTEKDSFLEWRRSLAQLQEGMGFVLTPFERNLEVWRQLWRVIERSDLLVQIVDARNPLRFRCEDLERYVLEMDDEAKMQGEEDVAPEFPTATRKRRNLLLINKADLLNEGQRRAWATYFDAQGITYAFFSAANAAAIQEANEAASTEVDSVANDLSGASLGESGASTDSSRILTVCELEALFERCAPLPDQRASAIGHAEQGKLIVGLVGYPNVGKSSTINALIGAKKVSVSSTPGKTKHFQTLHLSPTTVLCDCPGLVFPQFATTAAELVVDGVLPIDQLREYTGPAQLVAQRIPKDIAEAIYGIKIRTGELIADEQYTGLELLTAYAIARGFARQGQGNPDESRAARYVLKDYVNARLLYANPPEGVDPDDFNAAQREKLREELAKRGKGEHFDSTVSQGTPHARVKATPISDGIDAAFFSANSDRPTMLGRKGAPGASLRGRIAADGRDAGSVGNDEAAELPRSKKHFKAKRQKGRTVWNPYE
ncbi:P-loop containing nucleoside triphosphate hydrolase protein [Tilletiaria anomala UBC 951]|uniref:p-loop containing nucleoside triphosphate hydrolase protein n=1 Tax=Tilletiaria anomala (strain ATCC 24038 / CBS 436.72 / UBC 951) TaxID=1037660 RepID=A0A066WH35_TILAU|nr:P-loop containing nucleoside triphosphate hydrolase protein [Tilletiaria anomala UBC 951]KDN53307.1 P-loop containing nucleoside triphosphate hydrolase protein [Tilletiaria anomala UBC 951]